MNKIEKLLEEFCPQGVEFRALWESADIYTGTQLNKTGMFDTGKYPVLNGGIQPSGRYDAYNTDADTIAVSQGGASAGFVNFMREQFWAGAHCFVVKPTNQEVLNKFIYYFLKDGQERLMNAKLGAGIPGLNRGELKKLKIPIPPLTIQKEIVKILDNFTQLEAKLEAELEARKKQYEHYREALLSFGDECEWTKLNNVAEIGTGSSNTNEGLEKGLYPFFVRSQIVRYKNSFEFDETAIITSGDGVGVGKIFHYVNGKYALHQRAYRISITKNCLDSKFLFYYMKTTFGKYILRNAVNSSVTSVRQPMLNKYPVPIPPLAKQQEIVASLDKFDALVNDISTGLPAEIVARKKQYDYYRNQLLNFKPLEAQNAN